jgi:hypothetical protein
MALICCKQSPYEIDLLQNGATGDGRVEEGPHRSWQNPDNKGLWPRRGRCRHEIEVGGDSLLAKPLHRLSAVLQPRRPSRCLDDI